MFKHYSPAVAVVGFSAAGAACVKVLSDAGIPVAVFEKAPRGALKPCGEGLSAPGKLILDRLAVTPELSEYVPLQGYKLFSDSKTQLVLYRSGGIGVFRSTLQEAFYNASGKNGNVGFYFEEQVLELNEERDCVLIKTNTGREMRFKYILLAPGAHAKILKQIREDKITRWKIRKNKKNHRYGYTSHFEGEFQSANNNCFVSIFRRQNYEVYITPVSACKVNMSIVGKKEVFSEGKVKEVFESEGKRLLSQIGFSGALLYPPKGSGYFSAKRKNILSKRILFAGDASLCNDPVGGMGMTHALFSGVYGGEMILEALKNDSGFDENNKKYIQKNNQLKRKTQFLTLCSGFVVKSGSRILGRLSHEFNLDTVMRLIKFD
jgi:flavin-dependent dehydrogenase